MAWTSPRTWISNEVLPYTTMNTHIRDNFLALPRGNIGYAEVITQQSGISNADLTGYTKTVTVDAGKRIRVSTYFIYRQLTSASLVTVNIQEGATVLQTQTESKGISDYGVAYVSVVLLPSTGSHTYKVSINTTSGTVGTIVAATSPGYILVEDIGV